MLQQISADPLSLEKAAKRQEKRYRKAANPKRHSMATPVVLPEVRTEVKEEPESSSSDSDHIPPASGEGTEDTSSSSSSSSGDEDMPELEETAPPLRCVFFFFFFFFFFLNEQRGEWQKGPGLTLNAILFIPFILYIFNKIGHRTICLFPLPYQLQEFNDSIRSTNTF